MADDHGRFRRIGLGATLAPATSADPRASTAALAALRILVGLMWLYNVAWKRPPDFGKDSGNGLYRFTKDAVDHPVFPPYSWLVEHVILPNLSLFGWLVLAAETTLAVLLLTGTLVRVAALIGIGQSLAIALSVAQTPGEWPWSYWMMIGIHVVLLATASGAVAAVDAVRTPRSLSVGPGAEGRASRLVLGWGVVVTVAGLWASVKALGEPVLAAQGAQLGPADLSVALGRYNLLGALVLLAVGVLLVAAAGLSRPQLGRLAALLGLLAALSLYVQLGFSDPLLGGSNTSAAFFLSAALVGAVTASRPSSTTTSRQ